jgi:3-dehydroquinate dehydratase / shikimate dehydrogenase
MSEAAVGSAICVSVGRGRHRHMIAEYKHLAEQGAKLVELRLDFIQTPVNLKRLLAERPCPLIITVRRPKDGGLWKRTEEQRLMLIRTAIAEGVDYIDLEDDIAASIPRFGQTKRIVSYHNFHETPERLDEIHARLAGMNADVVKIATMAHSPHDNLRMLRLVKNASIPTAAFCMGEIGTPSRILAGKFGAPFTYATFHIERTMAPGQLAWSAMRDVYRYDKIKRDTEVFGVVADPVAHSLSPLIHNVGFGELGMNRVYVPFRVPHEHLKSFLEECQELGVRGLSVTIPHKETILPLLDARDEAVEGIKAANTLVFRDGKRHGYNTDHQAALDSIEHTMALSKGENSMAGKTALVLGAGGAAKALVFGLRRKGCDVVIASRTLERAEELASLFRGRAVGWSIRHGIRCDLIVNCTPVGMHPNVNESPFDGAVFKPDQVVFDTVYNPEQTLFVKEARKAGCTVITGIDMFVGQAAVQFKLFTGAEPPLDAMRNVLRRAISAARA